MCRFLPVTVAALVLSLPTAASWAQPKADRNGGDIAMRSVESLNQDGTGVKVIGGRPARTRDWPASFYSSSTGGRCTATLVGPRALLLAAHCVGNGRTATIEVRGVPHTGVCVHAKEYKDGQGDDSADYALCRMSKPVTGILFETVNRDPHRVRKNRDVLLTGYGCTQAPALGQSEPSGGNDGIYRIAMAKVAALPGEPGNEPNTILVRDRNAVCPGDSGGGAYIVLSPTRRFIVSVNSRVWFAKDQSYLSSLTSNDGKNFLDDWIEKNQGEGICGINLTGDDCR